MTGPDNSKKAAVIGHPVAHSLSPRLHNYWLRQYGISGEYIALDVAPEALDDTLRTLPSRGFVGVNITIPHKEAALHLVDDYDEAARKTGAVNTVIFSNGKCIGKNTDVYGFAENIKSATGDLSIYRHKAVVLGAGGAARAVIVALAEEGFKEIVIANRTRERAEKLAEELQKYITQSTLRCIDWANKDAALKEAGLLVNATAPGMEGKAVLEISLEALPKAALVTDIVYRPLMTPLLAQAKKRGNKIVDGLGMLLYQAQPAFESWFGVRPEVTNELREYIITK